MPMTLAPIKQPTPKAPHALEGMEALGTLAAIHEENCRLLGELRLASKRGSFFRRLTRSLKLLETRTVELVLKPSEDIDVWRRGSDEDLSGKVFP